jgi:hypothetical protein
MVGNNISTESSQASFCIPKASFCIPKASSGQNRPGVPVQLENLVLLLDANG